MSARVFPRLIWSVLLVSESCIHQSAIDQHELKGRNSNRSEKREHRRAPSVVGIRLPWSKRKAATRNVQVPRMQGYPVETSFVYWSKRKYER